MDPHQARPEGPTTSSGLEAQNVPMQVSVPTFEASGSEICTDTAKKNYLCQSSGLAPSHRGSSSISSPDEFQ